jgi:MFS family permease
LTVRLVSSLFALFFSVALLVVGNGFLMTLLGIRLSLDEVDPRLIGGVMVSYSIGFVLGSLYSSVVIQRVGHIRAFAVFCAVLAIASLVYPMTDNFPLWLGLRIVGGFAMAGLLIISESWFSAIATNDNRSTIFSLYQVCFYLATSIGQLLVTLGHPSNYFLFSLVAAILIAAIVPLSLTRMQAPHLEKKIERLSLSKVFAVSPLGLVSTLVSGIIVSSFYGVGPLFANLIGFSVDQIAWFMSASVFSAMLFAWPVGWLCDRIDRVTMLLYLAGLSALCSLILSSNLESFWLVIIANGAFMAFVAAIYPVGVALMNDRISHDQMISASATLLLSFGIGSCIGPVVSSALIEWVGAGGMYIGNTVLLLTLCVYVQYRLGKGLTVDVDHQEPYVALMPEVSPVINELNPLNDQFEEVPLEEIQPLEDIHPKEEPEAK